MAMPRLRSRPRIAPEVPHNEGAFRPVQVSAPRGSILNCVEPAAVASRHLVGHFLPGAIFGALAPAMPGQLMAGGADPIWMSVWRGTWDATKIPADPFMLTRFSVGWHGRAGDQRWAEHNRLSQRRGGHARRSDRDVLAVGAASTRSCARIRVVRANFGAGWGRPPRSVAERGAWQRICHD